MLEIRYNNLTKILTAWCADPEQFGKLKRIGHTVDLLDITIPNKPPEAWLYNETMQSLANNPDFMSPEPPRSTHISVLVAVAADKARPARIKRIWQGRDYFYDCFATQTVKDEFVAGKIAIGDYVIVHFDDIGEQIVTAKVWKSW